MAGNVVERSSNNTKHKQEKTSKTLAKSSPDIISDIAHIVSELGIMKNAKAK